MCMQKKHQANIDTETNELWTHTQDGRQQSDEEIMLGTVDGENQRGRTRREWLN